MTYGGAWNDWVEDLIKTSDGGYAMAGSTVSFGAGGYDFWLIKTDSAGAIQWNKTYGYSGDDHAYALVQTSDGGFALAGMRQGWYNDMWLVRTDSAGNMLWNKTYGGIDNEKANALVQTSDGGFVLAGDYHGACLLKTDSAGNMLWNRNYGTNRYLYDLLLISDGGYAMAGEANLGAGSWDFWLVKADESGNMVWNQTYHVGSAFRECRALGLVQTSDGGYAMAGWTADTNAAWLVRTDSSGAKLWDKIYGGYVYGDSAHDLALTIDGGFVLAGYSARAGYGNMWLIRTDTAGNMLWNTTYGGNGVDDAYAVVLTGDGRFALAGPTESYGYGSYGEQLNDAWLVFAQPPAYSLTVAVNPPAGGSVTRNPDLSVYELGTIVNLTAVPPAGWSFSGWSGTFSSSANPVSVIINGTTSVTATFTQIEYTLSITVVGSGSVDPSSAGPYHYGDVVWLTANAALGWSFSAWSGDASGSNLMVPVTMNGNKAVTATFTRIEYTLTVYATSGGSVSLNNTGPYYYGDVVKLTAIPNAGWYFISWSGSLIGNTNPATITMNGNRIANATFALIEYTLSINVPLGGSVTKIPDQPTYHLGDVVHLSAVPAPGFRFVTWGGDVSGNI